MMEAPLRAFLMVCSEDGSWAVSVCRDLDTTMRAWGSRGQPDRDVGILHVGFDRPPSQTFDKIAIAHPGRVLLTAAAKYALPSSFTASAAPVGVVENVEVFVGLQGWGYSLEDPTIGASNSGRASTVATPESRSWIASFLRKNPTATEILSTHGIYDDASYLEKESGLEHSIRHQLGVFRVHHLVGTKCHDPYEFASVAPPWLAVRELASLDLSTQICDTYKAVEIKTIRNLTDWPSEALLNQQNLDQKLLQDTVQAIKVALNEGPVQSVTIDKTADSPHLLAEIHQSLLSLSDRERDILIRRLGFETTPETLREIADDYDLSHERIRQIEARATREWLHESWWDDVLEQKLTQLLIGRSFPLPVAGVEAVDPWFEGILPHLEFFKNLIRVVCKDRIYLLEINGLFYFSLMSQKVWESAISEAMELLSSGSGQDWSEQYARSLVDSLLPNSAREFGALLWDMSSQLCHFSTGSNGSRILISFGRGAERLVEAILAESHSPLHYTEIAKRAYMKEGRHLDVRRAHNAAANVGYLFGRGTYGLLQHVPFSQEEMAQIRMEAENIICSEESGRQWHTFEILSNLSERLDDSFDGLDKYVLNIALTESEALNTLGKMIWVAAGQETDDQTRIDIHQAVVALIQAAGHPLSTNEIKEKLTVVRGINEFFQIPLIDPLIRVQPGVWGINDRDVPLSREEQQDLVEMLVHQLATKQTGIHAEELSKILHLRDCPLDAFLSIAIQDGRLKLAQDRQMYLTEWNHSEVN